MTKPKACVTRSAFDAQASALEGELKVRLDNIEPIGTPPSGTDVWDKGLPIDSKLVVTELRPVVKERLGAPFPLKFVRKGGYNSPDELIRHLMPQLRKWCPADAPTQNETSRNGTMSVPVAL